MRSEVPPGAFRMCLALLLSLAIILLACPGRASAAEREMRGIWMHATQIKTRAEADQWIARIGRANINAVFILVWYWGGQAFYHSDLCPMGDGVEEGFDPLGHMVQQCHKRGIEVHAWFVNGAYGAAEPRHVLDKHPDWAVDTGGGGELWYDFGKPEVRKFQSDLMIECLTKYNVDGLHFDYIRYGPRMCLCKHCQSEFAKRYGYEPITEQRTANFPVVASVSSNPAVEPTTAEVLVEFSNGTPAIAMNKLGAGEVLLLNWHAEGGRPLAVAETVKRTLSRWRASQEQVFVMDTEPNRERYGTRFTSAAVEWFRQMGYPAKPIREDRLPKLPKGSLLVLSAVYYIPDDTAKQLERFVADGGRLVVIDGPVHSMRNPSVQRVLGMKGAGRYFSTVTAMSATGHSGLVPSDGRKIDMEKEKLRSRKWAEFRKWGVTELVRDVYRRAKAAKPHAQVTAAVFTPLASAEKALQDWPRWLREGTIDYVIPMAYTMDSSKLADQLREWKSIDPHLERIVPGLSIYTRTAGGSSTRDIDLILSQHRLCMQAGAHGNVYFALHYLNDPLATAFKAGPHKAMLQAYRPATRNAP